MEREEAINRNCKARKCGEFIPGEPEAFKDVDGADSIRLGPCPQCGGWNILTAEGKTRSVAESYFEMADKGLNQVMELDRLRSGLPDTTGALIAETVDFLTATYRNAYEAGRRLIVLKEDTKHGNWLDNLENIGIARTTAHRLMGYARVVSNYPTSGNLSPDKVELLTSGGADWDDIENGEVLGRKIEDWERMSFRELRKEVKKLQELARKGTDTQDKLLAEKEALEAKVEELERAQLLTPTEAEQAAQRLTDDLVHSCRTFFKDMEKHNWPDYSEWTHRKLIDALNNIGVQTTRLVQHYEEELHVIGFE